MAEKFDLMELSIGYNRFVMPSKAAMAIFDALKTGELYKIDTKYKPNCFNTNSSIPIAYDLPYDELPTLKAINPVVFHTARLNHKKLEEYEEEQRKTKEQNAT